MHSARCTVVDNDGVVLQDGRVPMLQSRKTCWHVGVDVRNKKYIERNNDEVRARKKRQIIKIR